MLYHQNKALHFIIIIKFIVHLSDLNSSLLGIINIKTLLKLLKLISFTMKISGKKQSNNL